MTDRVLDISDAPARLRVDLNRLVVDRKDRDEVIVPLCDVAVLLVSHNQVTYTQAVLAGLMESGGVFVACNDSHLPIGIMLPLAGHHIQTQRMIMQAQVSKPVCKRIWQQFIQAKIHGQGQVLYEISGDDKGLQAMAKRVKSGDPANLEAQAARKYWRPLFNDDAFRRNQEAADQNAQLNYGYGVLRAIIARGVCAAGLHPTLGIHHSNQYNAYCLVDDTMEPYRPIVDRIVAQWVVVQGKAKTVDKEFKAFMIRGLLNRFSLDDEKRTLFDCAFLTTSSMVAVMEGKQKDIALPEWWL